MKLIQLLSIVAAITFSNTGFAKAKKVAAPAETKTSKINFNPSLKAAEVGIVNYLQSGSGIHSFQFSWVPHILTYREKFHLGARVGFTFLTGSADSNFIAASIDLLPAYQLSESLKLELLMGVDVWEGIDAYFEVGPTAVLATKESFLKKISWLADEAYLGYSYIFNDDLPTSNVALGIRKRF